MAENACLLEKPTIVRRAKANSIYSTGKHIELLNLNKKKFQVSIDGQLHTLDEIKAKKLFNYSETFNEVDFDEIEELLIETQEMLPKDDNSYKIMRLSEILVTFYHHFEMVDDQIF